MHVDDPAQKKEPKVVAPKPGTKSNLKHDGMQNPMMPSVIQASKQYVVSYQSQDAVLSALLPNEMGTANTVHLQELMLSELNTARLLNIEMTSEPKQFIQLLESRIQEITGARKNVILILDEESGTYRCLNDEVLDNFATVPRELTWISDRYLQDLLDSDQVIHSFLQQHGNVFGIIALADKNDGSAFTSRDEIVLDQLTQYLSVQVNHFLTLKKSMTLPMIQRVVLQTSNALLGAADSMSIFRRTLETLTHELPFTAGQYIRLNRQTGQGQVLCQMSPQGFETDLPDGCVDQFSSLLSLFQSQVWKNSYLYLKGEMLGDKAFSEIFGLPDIASVVLLPMMSSENQLDGALVLLQQGQPMVLSKEALQIIEQVSSLLLSACERAKILEQALEIATTDELTRVMNRRGFYNSFDAEVDRARRNLSSLCLAVIDIDHFKLVNDSYGHMTGDQVLRKMAAMIQKSIRKSDVLCRFGGEEFTLLLPETTLAAATELIERLRRKLEKCSLQTTAGPIKVTFSAGIGQVETMKSLSKSSMDIISTALERADEALYEAKQLGRNRVVVVEEA